MKRRELVRKLMKATGLREPTIYVMLSEGRKPINPNALKAWNRVIKANAAAPAPASAEAKS